MSTATPSPLAGFTATPVTKWTGQDWSNIVVFKQRIPADGHLLTTYTLSGTAGPATYLGDADGRITEVVQAPMAMSSMQMPATALDEIVTRADGSTLSVGALLDAIVTAALTAPVVP